MYMHVGMCNILIIYTYVYACVCIYIIKRKLTIPITYIV